MIKGKGMRCPVCGSLDVSKSVKDDDGSYRCWTCAGVTEYNHPKGVYRKALAAELRFNRRIYDETLRRVLFLSATATRDELLLDANELDVCLASIRAIRLLVGSLKGRGLI